MVILILFTPCITLWPLSAELFLFNPVVRKHSTLTLPCVANAYSFSRMRANVRICNYLLRIRMCDICTVTGPCSCVWSIISPLWPLHFGKKKELTSRLITIYVLNVDVPIRLFFLLVSEVQRILITKTSLYNSDPLKPHFYIVKLGFTGVYIIFLISAQNIDCGYSLEPPRRGGSNEYPQSMFWAEIWKISEFFYVKIFLFWL